MNETKYWVWLTMIFGCGSRRIWRIMSAFETAEDAYNAIVSDRGELRLSEKERENLRSVTIGQAEQLIESCARNRIEVVDYGSVSYPYKLRHIADPPAVLYCCGDISALNVPQAVTAVGARKSKESTLAVIDRICGELAESGVVIISGFAVGADITAHLAAANRGLPTICVMGCGVDVDYPKQNFCHRDKIIQSGGVFISEYPPGTPPYSTNFPKRNRIISALGGAAMIFEATEKSGSIITASLAAEQGRTVFCMPPSDIFDPAFSGNSMLLRKGAVPLLGIEDVLDIFEPGTPIHTELRSDAYSLLNDCGTIDLSGSIKVRGAGASRDEHKVVPVKVHSVKRALPEDAADSPPTRKVQKRQPVKAVPETAKAQEPQLEGIQKQIMDELEKEPLIAEELADRLGVGLFDILVDINDLEKLGVIQFLPGKIIKKIKR